MLNSTVHVIMEGRDQLQELGGRSILCRRVERPVICYDSFRGRFKRSNLDDGWAKCFLHGLVHGVDVPTVGGDLDILAQFQPVVVGAPVGDPLGVVASLAECS